MSTYGRHRQSIADIEHELYNIFNQHPNSHLNDAGEPVIPADALVDVFKAFSDVYNGVQLMNDDETTMLRHLLTENPGLEVTPNILLGFIAEKTKHSPPRSPNIDEELDLPLGRGRSSDREEETHGRSSSNESAFRSSGGGSRASSRGPPQTPTSAKSPFDTQRRQRSTPLANNAPSSWTKRPAPAHRRKSDAGSRSDSESYSDSPSSFGRTPGRTRAPSNPTSPSTDLGAFSPVTSPTFGLPASRPHSRARSQPQSHFNNTGSAYHYGSPGNDRGYSSPDDDHTIDANPLYDYPNRRADGDQFMHSISSLVMPRPSSSSDSDSDGEEDSALGLVMDRSTTSSTVSMEPMDRLDVLQRANTELSKKLMDAERTLQNKLAAHESELEDMQGRLDELEAELVSTKREEKELRTKERQSMISINQLETEIAKVNKNLETAKTTYANLNKLYQEQCAFAERVRDDLRQRDEALRRQTDANSLHELENQKWAQEHEALESRIAYLETELSIAQQAHAQLDEQKQENMLLKETIDRMRFDMDEMRNNAVAAAGAGGGGSGQSSAVGSVSKSLGAELLGKMKGGWGMEEEEEGGEESGGIVFDDEEDTESEDVIQTIITRKRKVASRANKLESTRYEETKEYSDSSTQYDPGFFHKTHSSQTDPEPKILTASFSIQTDDTPVGEFATQTDPEPLPPVRVTSEMEIQTDEPEPPVEVIEVSRSPSPQNVESMASSSSTIVPPTPKPLPLPHTHTHTHSDQSPPPAYDAEDQDPDQQDWLTIASTLKKWHPGSQPPFSPIKDGVSEDALEDWKALKEELGVDCLVIDKILSSSARVASPGGTRGGSGKDKPRRGGRFYNIYNTYVYGDADRSSASASASGGPSTGLAGQVAMWVGATALVILAVSPYMVPYYAVPGGPTYYDRAAWSSFNTMQAAGEGFSPDGTAAVWNFLGRVGGGAARIARGWPT